MDGVTKSRGMFVLDNFFKGMSDVFSTFGAGVFVPVILFVIAIGMGVKGKKPLTRLFSARLD